VYGRGPFLWIAPVGHYEYLHIDPDDNFLLILSGSKTIRLFAPGTPFFSLLFLSFTFN
jgi:hypothetical protein